MRSWQECQSNEDSLQASSDGGNDGERSNRLVFDLSVTKWFTVPMTARWEQIQSELPKLLELVQRGEEVVITKEGRVVARLSGVPQIEPLRDRKVWLSRLARLREATATGKTSPTTDEILADLRSERGQ
jgi:antitoxin (DNA-binding transcriptional repressor) of toxin-antitoxin stability system